jgi:hypothetical protein
MMCEVSIPQALEFVAVVATKPASLFACSGWEIPLDSLSAEKMLSMQEQEWWEASGYLAVISPNKPGRVYRVCLDGDVVLFEGSEAPTGLYLQAAENLAGEVVPFLHKHLIEANEQRYLEIVQRIPLKQGSLKALDLPRGCGSSW